WKARAGSRSDRNSFDHLGTLLCRRHVATGLISLLLHFRVTPGILVAFGNRALELGRFTIALAGHARRLASQAAGFLFPARLLFLGTLELLSQPISLAQGAVPRGQYVPGLGHCTLNLGDGAVPGAIHQLGLIEHGDGI